MIHTALAFLPWVLFFPWVWFRSLHSDSEVYPLYFGWHEFCKLGTESKAAGSLYCTHAVSFPLLHPDKEKCSKAGVLQFSCVFGGAVQCSSMQSLMLTNGFFQAGLQRAQGERRSVRGASCRWIPNTLSVEVHLFIKMGSGFPVTLSARLLFYLLPQYN